MKNNLAKRAIDLFGDIEHPNEIVVILLFNACAQLETAEALDLTKKVAKEMLESFYANPRISSSLLDALIKCGDISSAEILFSKMTKSSANYAVLMGGFNKENNFDKTLRLFDRMKLDGVEADLFTYLRVIKAASRLGDYSLSRSIVEEIPRSLLSYNQIQTALIDMWVR